jgi:hypothetical protein
MKAKPRITAVEMKCIRLTEKYCCIDHIRSGNILEKLKPEHMLGKISKYETSQIQHVGRMLRNRLSIKR